MVNAQLKTPEQVRTFALAGNATLTLVSKETGNRFTFKIRQKDQTTPHFVKLLCGSDNESDYQFLGSIFDGHIYRHGKRSRIGMDAPSARAFEWFWKQVEQGRLSDKLEVWHEGRCGRCGRKLTVPSSIESGIGPICDGRAS